MLRASTPGTRAIALLLAWGSLAGCGRDDRDDSGGGASGLGGMDGETAATVSTHVAPAPSHASAAAGNDPDSPQPAPAQDAGTAAHGDASTSIATGAAGSASAANEAAPPRLRDAEVGAAPRFDPAAVYMLGMSSEGVDNSVQAIAPVVDLSDSVFGIDWFSHDWITNDGRLLYQDNNYGDPVREFLRDPAPATGITRHEGETELTSSLPCNPLESVQNAQRRYLVAWDGSLYHTCGSDDVVPPSSNPDVTAWYDAAGNPMYSGDIWTARVGTQGHALGQRGDTLIVFDFGSGAELGGVALDGQLTIAARMHDGGFWVALRDPQTGARSWLDVDLSGALSTRGDYAPLPDGVSYVTNSNPWMDGGMAVIDGVGRLYEFASQAGVADAGSDLVVVRRPRGEGRSDVPYRTADFDPNAPHDIYVVEPILITGG